MDKLIKVAKVSEMSSGLKTVAVAGKRVILVKVEDSIFAIDDTCTHSGCSLAGEGYLEGNVITCGCHGAQFDVTTGKALALPAVSDVATYEVKVENGEVYIKT